jgi:hypothetical protein
MSDPLQDVLERLNGVSETGDGWKALCPAHDDNDPSLSVTEGDDQPVVLHCWAGCRPEAVVDALGLQWGDICEGEPIRDDEEANTLSEVQRERQEWKRRRANTTARLKRVEEAKEKMTRHERMLFRLCCRTDYNGDTATEAKKSKRNELIDRALSR